MHKALIRLCVCALFFPLTQAQDTKITAQHPPVLKHTYFTLQKKPINLDINIADVVPITERLVTIVEFNKRKAQHETALASFLTSKKNYQKASQDFAASQKKANQMIEAFNREFAKHKNVFDKHKSVADTLTRYEEGKKKLPLVKKACQEYSEEKKRLLNSIELKEARIDEIEKQLLEMVDNDATQASSPPSNKTTSKILTQLDDIKHLSEHKTGLELLQAARAKDNQSKIHTLSIQLENSETEIQSFAKNDRERRTFRLKVELSRLLGQVTAHKKRLTVVKDELAAAETFIADIEPWLKKMAPQIDTYRQSFIELDKKVKAILPKLTKMRDLAQKAIERHEKDAETLRVVTNALEDALGSYKKIRHLFLTTASSIEVVYCNVSESATLKLSTQHSHYVFASYQSGSNYAFVNHDQKALEVKRANPNEMLLPNEKSHPGDAYSASKHAAPVISNKNQGSLYVIFKGKGTLRIAFNQAAMIHVIGKAVKIRVSKHTK